MNENPSNKSNKPFSSGLFWGLLLGLLIGIFAITALTEYFFKIKSFFRTPKAEKKHELVIQEILSENESIILSSDSVLKDSLIKVDSSTYAAYWDIYINKPGYKELDSLTLDSLIKVRIEDSLVSTRRKEDKMIDNATLDKIMDLSIVKSGNSSMGEDSLMTNSKLRIELYQNSGEGFYYHWSTDILKLYGVFDHPAIHPLFFKNAWYLSLNNQFYLLKKQRRIALLHPIQSVELVRELSDFCRINKINRKSVKN